MQKEGSLTLKCEAVLLQSEGALHQSCLSSKGEEERKKQMARATRIMVCDSKLKDQATENYRIFFVRT
jgi:hypothetical protein